MDSVESGRRGGRALHFAGFYCPRERTMSPVEARGARLAPLLPGRLGSSWTQTNTVKG